MTEFSRCHPEVALERTNILVGCYRRGEAENANVYVAAVASILTQFPEEIVRKVTDPVKGLPSRSNWLPSVAEVRSACDEEMGPFYRQEERQRRAGESWKMLVAPAPATPEQRARAVEHWEKEVRPTIAQPVEAKPKETPWEALERMKAMAHTPVVIGDELAKKLNLIRKDAAA